MWSLRNLGRFVVALAVFCAAVAVVFVVAGEAWAAVPFALAALVLGVNEVKARAHR